MGGAVWGRGLSLGRVLWNGHAHVRAHGHAQTHTVLDELCGRSCMYHRPGEGHTCAWAASVAQRLQGRPSHYAACCAAAHACVRAFQNERTTGRARACTRTRARSDAHCARRAVQLHMYVPPAWRRSHICKRCAKTASSHITPCGVLCGCACMYAHVLFKNAPPFARRHKANVSVF